MDRVLTSGQMRRLEADMIRSGRRSGECLMERAGEAVVEEICRRWGARRGDGTGAPGPDRDVLVFCGPGNNGGDGFVVARLLAELGWPVRVAMFGRADRIPPDAAANLEKWRRLGDIHPIGARDKTDSRWISKGKTILVDALFGTGLSRPLGGGLGGLLMEAACRAPLAMVAIDVPSGVCSDSGRLLNPVPPFDLTVTFHTAKPGHFLAEGAGCCGDVVVRDITLEDGGDPAAMLTGLETLALKTSLEKRAEHHKYVHGHTLIVSGPAGRGGAARLAARGALRVGAGLVTVACENSALGEHAAQLNAIMTRGFDRHGDFEQILADVRINSLCAGPALGLHTGARRLVSALLRSDRCLVLDADALTMWGDTPCSLMRRLHPKVVLTPHLGEFSRLFPDISEKHARIPETWPAYSRIDAAREAAGRAGCTVVLKGADTVIATPGKVPWLNAATGSRSVPWLATAGSGDVLAGMIAGLLGRGLEPHQAAASAVYLHTEAARQFGPGLVSEDIAEELPPLFRSMGVNRPAVTGGQGP